LAEELGVVSGDRIIDKHFPNAFWETELTEVLRALSVDSVVVCGCFFMACVYLTHEGAPERRFDSQILKDGTVSSDPESIRMLMQIADSVSLEAVFSV